jgi:hypothetical protein
MVVLQIYKNRKRRYQNKQALVYIKILAALAVTYYALNLNRSLQHTSSYTGRRWMEELLLGHPTRIKDNLGISQAGFRYLENLLIRKSRLKDTRHMDTTEQLGLFLLRSVRSACLSS